MCCGKNSKVLGFVVLSVVVAVFATIVANLIARKCENQLLDEKDADIKECGC
ncbi:MAG: hypothetical protein FWE23_09780 [Chitinivibrionia bacterium]|nr:hypothetical protein [Chitinivibrionia bacterium]